jgi:hypothetical protein
VAADVNDHALAFLLDPEHGFVKLHAAITSDAAEDVTREALGVHAHQDILLAGGIALHERHVRSAVVRLVTHRAERALGRGYARFRHPAHEFLHAAPVGNEVGDRDDREAVLFGKSQ